MEIPMLELADWMAKRDAGGDELARATLVSESCLVVRRTPERVEFMNDGEEFELAAKQPTPDELLEGGLLRHVISDETLDRHGDIVSAKGWVLDNYSKNPVILWAHSHGIMPIGKSVEIGVKRKRLISVGEYPSASVYEFGNTAFRLAALGYMPAVSVGFMPLKFELLDEEDPWGGVKTLQQDLWEYSMVPVPANPNALTLAAKGGMDITVLKKWAEEVLDTADHVDSKREKDGASDTYFTAIQGLAKLAESLQGLVGAPVSIQLGTPYSGEAEAEQPSVEEKEADMKTQEAFLGDTRDHEEEIRIRQDQADPVVLTIVDEPTFDVDEVHLQAMIREALERRQGRLIDRDFMEE